jgi:hypothetical protein
MHWGQRRQRFAGPLRFVGMKAAEREFVKPASSLFALAAAALLAVGCGSNPAGPPQNPSNAEPAQPAPSAQVDPAAGTSDLNSATNSASTPPATPESAADPGGHAPVVSTGSSTGETPINSGAGDAVPEKKH